MTVVWVVQIKSLHDGPMLIGYRDQLPAIPARAADLQPVSSEYPPPRSGATHHWGGAMVRLASEADARTADATPYSLYRGRPVPSCRVVS